MAETSVLCFGLEHGKRCISKAANVVVCGMYVRDGDVCVILG